MAQRTPIGPVYEPTGTIYQRDASGNLKPTSDNTGTGSFEAVDTSNGMTPYTGFASQYTSGMLDNIYDNPWYILQDVFNGISTSSPGYQALRDFGGDPLSLYNIMAGSQQNIDGGAGAFANFMNQLYSNLGTPGGAGFDSRELLRSIFSQNKFGAESDNTLGQILGAGDMNTQIRTLFNLLRDVANVSMNPLAASGYQSAIAQGGDMYGNAMLKSGAGATMNPVEWINQNLPHLAVR